jgi:hypothetical protein
MWIVPQDSDLCIGGRGQFFKPMFVSRMEVRSLCRVYKGGEVLLGVNRVLGRCGHAYWGDCRFAWKRHGFLGVGDYVDCNVRCACIYNVRCVSQGGIATRHGME